MNVIHDYARFIGASLDARRSLHSFKNSASQHKKISQA